MLIDVTDFVLTFEKILKMANERRYCILAIRVFPVSFLLEYSTMLTHINTSFANYSFDCIIGKFVGGNLWTLRCLACWKVESE